MSTPTPVAPTNTPTTASTTKSRKKETASSTEGVSPILKFFNTLFPIFMVQYPYKDQPTA